MPTLSMFYGIIVYMYNEKGSKHNIPHVHAEYQDEKLLSIWMETFLKEACPKTN